MQLVLIAMLLFRYCNDDQRAGDNDLNTSKAKRSEEGQGARILLREERPSGQRKTLKTVLCVQCGPYDKHGMQRLLQERGDNTMASRQVGFDIC